jgi:hypothetical protein
MELNRSYKGFTAIILWGLCLCISTQTAIGSDIEMRSYLTRLVTGDTVNTFLTNESGKTLKFRPVIRMFLSSKSKDGVKVRRELDSLFLASMDEILIAPGQTLSLTSLFKPEDRVPEYAVYEVEFETKIGGRTKIYSKQISKVSMPMEASNREK